MPVDNIEPADPSAIQRPKLDLLREQDSAFARSAGNNDAVESAIRNYETAWQMQRLLPEAADIRSESEATRKLYGVDASLDYQRFYALQCLRGP